MKIIVMNVIHDVIHVICMVSLMHYNDVMHSRITLLQLLRLITCGIFYTPILNV